MHISDKSSHRNSDDHKNHHNKVWCEDCNKYLSDTTRRFQSEIHLINRQNNSNLVTQFDNNVELIVNERTYIKPKINPTENLEEQIKNLLRTNFFPRYKFQLSYLAKFSKIVNGEEEVFKRWVKSDLNSIYLDQDVYNTLMQKLDDEQLEGSGFVYQK